jgi:hypothetical protein
MATTEEYKNGGSASYSFSIERIKDEDIKVSVDGTDLTYTATNPPTQTTEYTVNGSNVIFKEASVSGSTSGGVRIYRETALENADSATFVAGSSIRAADLNANHKLVKFSAQEQNQKIVTADIKDSQITSAKILDGTIVDADVNASAAIAGTKIAPDFGSQNITTTGNISTSGTINNLTTTEVAILDGATVNTTELNTLDGITASTAELNILDGVTATTAEINTLDGVTASTAEINTLDGVTASTSEINTLDGITASTAELNILDGATISTTQLNNLQNIEPAAKDDQTASEIKTLYEDSGNDNKSYIKTTYESNADTNEFTDAEKTKLGNLGSLNALSDVNTAGVSDNKILKYDASVSQFIIADESGGGSGGSSTFTGLSDSPANYGSAAGKVLKVNSGETALEFSDADVVADTTPQLGGNLDVQASEINTSTTNGNIKLAPNGTGVVEVKGNTNAGTLKLNCENNSHGVKIKSPAHSNNADYTVTLFNQDPSYLQHASFVKIDSGGQLSIDNKLYHGHDEHISMGGFDITFAQTGGIYFDSDNSNNNKVGFFGNQTIPSNVNFHLPGADGPAGTFLKTDGAGNLSFASAAVVADTTPQLGGDLDCNGKSINLDNYISLDLKSGATNAVVNGVTQHVAQGSLIIDGGQKDIFFTNGSQGSKITFGSSDGATHEVMRITPSVLGASQHGKVELKYVTANAGGNTFSGTKLATTATGVSITGTALVSSGVLAAQDSTADIGTPSVRFRNIYADTLYGDGQYLTNVDPTVANGCIYENSTEISADHTTSTTKNSMSAGPITIANNVTLTIPNNSVYTIV